MIPDDFARTVKIPIRIVDGVPQPFYGPTWPRLIDGAVGDLLIPAHAFVNSQDEVVLTAPLGVEILSAGTVLLVAVSSRAVGEGIVRREMDFAVNAPFEAFLEVRLDEALRLQLRGTKKGRLEPCVCTAIHLGKTCDSVNEVYSLISETYEPHRRSHTGNVFEKVMFQHRILNDRPIWEPLAILRDELEAKLEARFQGASPTG